MGTDGHRLTPKHETFGQVGRKRAGSIITDIATAQVQASTKQTTVLEALEDRLANTKKPS